MKLKALASALVVLGVAIVGLGATSPVAAQDATPIATPIVGASQVAVAIRDVNGEDVGTATFTEGEDGVVTVEIEVMGLSAGEHGIHVHETGACDPAGDEPFSSAGSHFNPATTHHGGPPTIEAGGMTASPEATMTGHAGDLGNITVAADGSGTATVETDRFTLSTGATSLQDADGSAIVIHADTDDLTTDPSGNSGDRIACGVVFPAADATPVASA